MLTKYSVKKPFTIYVAVIVILIFGIVSFYKMTPDLFPDINTPYALVTTSYPGATPEEVEVRITKPVEKQLASLTGVENLTSVSGDSYSLISIEFNSDINMDAAGVDIREKVDQIKSLLPEEAQAPVISKINMNMVPVMIAAVGMKDSTPEEVSDYTKENLISPLEGVQGVASLTTTGIIENGIKITLDRDKINDVNDRIAAAVNSTMGTAENKLSSGLGSARSAKNKIAGGKTQMVSGSSKLSSAIKKLEKEKRKLQKLKKIGNTVWIKYQAAKSEQEKEILESAMKAYGFADAEAFGNSLQTADDTIALIDEQIRKLNESRLSMTFNYTDLSLAQATVESTVNELQKALSEFKTQKDAALASADMTGVLTMENVSAILTAQNFSMPAGYVSDGKSKVLVNVGDKVKNKTELENLVVLDPDINEVSPVRLRDIADVTYASDAGASYAKIDGESGILLSFTKQSMYATATVCDNILEKFETLETEHKDVTFTPLMNQGEYIHLIINSVLKNLLLGAVLAILILFFFLRDIRPTLVTAVSIPVSVVFAVALMYFSGVTLNMISLSGLAIGVGMLVDNSIVVTENIYRLRALGYTRVQSAVSGAKQVAGAITSSTLTTICVFAPIVFVSGMTKDIFKDLALTVTYSLLASLLIALTMVPALSKGVLVRETHSKKTLLGQNSRLLNSYRKWAYWTLDHKKIVLGAAALLLVLSSAGLLIKGFEYMPSMASEQISATIEMPEGTSLKKTARVNDEIAAEMQTVDGVETVGVMLTGGNGLSLSGGEGSNDNVTDTMMYIVLDPSKTKQGKVIAKKLEKYADKYGCEIETSAENDMSSMMGTQDISIALYGDDLDALRNSAKKIEKAMNDMGSLEDISSVTEDSTDELKVVVDKNTAMSKGITTSEIYSQVASKLTEKNKATSISTGGKTIDVTIKSSAEDFTKHDLENLTLRVTNKADGKAKKIPLSSVADIQESVSLSTIRHENQKRKIDVSASLMDGYNTTKVTRQLRDRINEDDLIDAGVKIQYKGQYEEIADAMRQMVLMLIVGLLLVYLIMVAQFQSLRSPFIIIFTIPLAFTGGMIALLICGQTLSVVSMMGFVMLMGIIVNNGIVLVDCINRFRTDGIETRQLKSDSDSAADGSAPSMIRMDMNTAIVYAGSVRMRPVLMTAATTILGLLPMALGLGNGAEMVQPVAITCIGGLVYATFMTLFVVPAMYKLLGKKHLEKIDESEFELIEE